MPDPTKYTFQDAFNFMQRADREMGANSRMDTVARVLNLDGSRKHWSDLEHFALAFFWQALRISGAMIDTSWEEPSRVVLELRDPPDRVRKDLLLLVGIGPEITGLRKRGKGTFERMCAPSFQLLKSWESTFDQVDRFHPSCIFQGALEHWSNIVSNLNPYRPCYYIGDIDGPGDADEAARAGIEALLDNPRASFMLIHQESQLPISPRVLTQTNVHRVRVSWEL